MREVIHFQNMSLITKNYHDRNMENLHSGEFCIHFLIFLMEPTYFIAVMELPMTDATCNYRICSPFVYT